MNRAGVRNSGIVGGTGAVIRGNRINASAGITLLGCRTSTIADNWVVRGRHRAPGVKPIPDPELREMPPPSLRLCLIAASWSKSQNPIADARSISKTD